MLLWGKGSDPSQYYFSSRFPLESEDGAVLFFLPRPFGERAGVRGLLTPS